MFYLPRRKDKYYIEEIEVKSPFKDTRKVHDIFERLQVTHDKFSLKGLGSLREFLLKHNYFDEQKMPKKRMIYQKGYYEVIIDNVDNVGVVVELECEKDEPLEIVEGLLNKDEWERSVEGTSYIWLKNVKGLNSHIKNLKRFFREPAWNVWKNERRMYGKLNSSNINTKNN